MSILEILVIVLFVALVLANFVVQVVVAARLSLNPLRGTHVFVQGWKQAKARGMQPLMEVWSYVLVGLIVMLIPVIIVGARSEDDVPSTNRQTNVQQPVRSPAPRPTATVTPIVSQWQITYPRNGQVISQQSGTVEVQGVVYFDPAAISHYSLALGYTNRPGSLPGGIRYSQSVPNGGIIGRFDPAGYPAGEYILAVAFVKPDGPTFGEADFEAPQAVRIVLTE